MARKRITNVQLEAVALATLSQASIQLQDATVTIPRDRYGKLKCPHLYEVRGTPENVKVTLGMVPLSPTWFATFPTLFRSALSIRRGELIADEVRGEARP